MLNLDKSPLIVIFYLRLATSYKIEAGLHLITSDKDRINFENLIAIQ